MATTIQYMVGRKRLFNGGKWWMPGEIIPDAARWKNLAAYVDAGLIVVIETEDVGDSGAVSDAPKPVTPTELPESLDDLTKKELRALADERGVETNSKMNKAQLIAALEA